MSDEPKLTKRQIDGLMEIWRIECKGRRYYWRSATMRSLAALGYITQHARREFRLTDAGRIRAKTLEGG